MQRILCRAFGGPDMLELVDEPTPEVGPNDVLTEVETAGVSFVDGLIVNGKYGLRPMAARMSSSIRLVVRRPSPPCAHSTRAGGSACSGSPPVRSRDCP